jgi:hypothetical protein
MIVQSVSHYPGTGTSTNSVVFATIYEENVQTGETLLEAYGDSALPQTFTVAGSLESASLNMTLPMYDDISGATLSVTFNITWKGVGPTTQMIDSQHFRSPSSVLMAHSVGYNRMAIASGTISDGTTNYASGVTTDASLDSSKGGNLYFGGN